MGKYVLIVLGLLSLGWIGYVGINITSLGDRITPETTFGKADRSIVVVHKPLEIDFTEPGFAFLSENDFYSSILTHTERIQHFYFSGSRPVILLERSKPWTIELIDRYFASMGIRSELDAAKSFRLSNGWNASYDKEYLRVSKLPQVPDARSAIAWKYVDRKSSASVIGWENGAAQIENAYRNSASEIRYIAQDLFSEPSLADDQDVFQDVVPAKFTAYEFYEKHYLRSISPTASELPFDWMASGAALVSYDGDRCIVTDCIPGQDPIAVLGNKLDENSVSENKNSAFVNDVSLPQQLLKANNWYIEVFNNRVFIAAKKSAIDAIIGAYETGATLSQNEQLRSALFLRAPKRVSYRKITPEEHRTISLLGYSRHTVVQRLGGEAPAAPAEPQAATIRIDGGIAQLIPVQGTNFLYVISRSNVVYGIQGDTERWKIALPSEVVGRAALSHSGNELVVTTATTIHQLSRSGSEANGKPIALNAAPVTAAVSYSWRGTQQLAVPDETQLQIFNVNGTLKTAIALPFAPRNAPFVIWANAGELTATILGKNKGVNLPVERKRKGRTFELPDIGLQGIKTPNGPLFFGIRNKRVIAVNTKGIMNDLNRGNATTIFPIEETGENFSLKVLCSNKLYILSPEGKLLASITPGFNDVAGCAWQTTASGKSVVGILDGIANKNYIYDINGKRLTTESFDGTSVIALHKTQNGRLVLISESNDYLVRYAIEN